MSVESFPKGCSITKALLLEQKQLVEINGNNSVTLYDGGHCNHLEAVIYIKSFLFFLLFMNYSTKIDEQTKGYGKKT